MGTIRSGVAGGPYRSTNSRPAAPTGRASPPRLTRPLPPPPLALDHPPKCLMAGGAAEPLAGAPLRGEEVLLAPRTIAGKRSGPVRCALTLARRRRTGARRVGRRGISHLSFGRTSPLGAATPVSSALVPALLLTVGGPPVLPAGPSLPPPPRRRTAFGATVPGLRVGGSKGLLAPLEETAPLSRPTSPLTGAGRAASVEWAQGSGELPAAKPRVRSPLASAPRRLL
jgi:hypothetical protein